MRDYMLVKRTGWTLDEIDAASAIRSDWILALGVVDDEAAEEHRLKQRQAELDQLGGRR